MLDVELIVYDEPTAQRHRVTMLAPSPDPQRPGWMDPRKTIALVGQPEHRPPELRPCPACFPLFGEGPTS